MNKRITVDFIQDQLSFTLTYFGGMALTMMFYRLELGAEIEVLYPIMLATFVYLLFMLVRFIRYARFCRLLHSFNGGISDDVNRMKFLTNEQRRAVDVMLKIDRQATNKLNQLEQHHDHKHKIISQIAHNIKTPTSVIDLVIQHSKQEEDANVEILEKINKENRLINESLNQVLSYLRLDYFQNDFSIEEVNLVDDLRELINKKKEHFIYNGVFPRMIVEGEKIPILTDKKWNKILIEQILSNAIKYTAPKEDEKLVYVRVKKTQEHAQLTIEDTGIGISPFDVKRVFEPFFTGENGRMTRNATGFGLYLSKMIADRLHHQIMISSEPGQGTKLTITYLTKS